MPQRRLMHVFSTFGGGGPAVRFVQVANRLGSRYRHVIAAMDGRQECRDLLDPALDVEFIRPQLVKAAALSLGNLRRCRALLRSERPDLLLTYNWGAIEWAAANRLLPVCPHLHFEDGFGPDETGGRQIARRVLFRRLALGGSRVVVPSRVLERIAVETWRLDRGRVIHVPNGVDLSRFRAAERPCPGREVVIGTVGALRPEKNIARLIRAIARLGEAAPVRLVIVGDGPERDHLEDVARRSGIAARVTFAGQRERPEELLDGFDAFALSSDTEQMPLSLLEAMATGLPVAATDVGDVAAMLPPESRAFVVPREDDAQFADRLGRLVASPDLRLRLGRANRRWAEAHHGQERMLETYRALFDGQDGFGES